MVGELQQQNRSKIIRILKEAADLGHAKIAHSEILSGSVLVDPLEVLRNEWVGCEN